MAASPCVMKDTEQLLEFRIFHHARGAAMAASSAESRPPRSLLPRHFLHRQRGGGCEEAAAPAHAPAAAAAGGGGVSVPSAEAASGLAPPPPFSCPLPFSLPVRHPFPFLSGSKGRPAGQIVIDSNSFVGTEEYIAPEVLGTPPPQLSRPNKLQAVL